MNWDKYFMSMTALIAMKSKDKNTHFGCVIVDSLHRIKATGYNSFVRGLNDNIPERQERPEKYFWFEHSERNAIYNACGNDLSCCTLYVNGIPCMDCARAIIQAGITEVVYWKPKGIYTINKWREHEVRTFQIFKETGVSMRAYEEEIIDELYFLFDGKRTK